MEERKYFHVQLITASAAHKKRSRQSFTNLGLTEGQPKVLSILRGMEGCQQKELASFCHVEPATMTSLLSKMEQCNLIYRDPKKLPGGARANSIFLTDLGKEKADAVLKLVQELENVAFDGFREEEKELFLEFFERVRNNLEEK